MDKLIIWNNPFLNYQYYAEVELDAGKIFYRTNVTENQLEYRCFYLLSKEKIKKFFDNVQFIEQWESLYGVENQVILDGFHWKIELIENNIEKEIKGNNLKPDNFGFFISELENLLQKDFGGQYVQ